MSTQSPRSYKNPAVATILSFFFPGLGQIYNGQIDKGFIFILIFIISSALVLEFIGLFTTPIIWIWGMVDAYKSAKEINEKIASAQV